MEILFKQDDKLLIDKNIRLVQFTTETTLHRGSNHKEVYVIVTQKLLVTATTDS